MGLFSEIKKLFTKVIPIFPDPKEIKPPPPPPPPQELTTEIGAGAQDQLRRQQRSKTSSRRRTIVTGDLTPETSKKTLLGL